MAARIAKHFGLDPQKYVVPTTGDRRVDLTMDMSCLAARVKTRSCMFDELFDEMRVPADVEDWLKAEGKPPVKRFKL